MSKQEILLIGLIIFSGIEMISLISLLQNETAFANEFCKQNGFDNYDYALEQGATHSCVKFDNGNVTFKKLYIDHGNEFYRVLNGLSFGLIPRDELKIGFIEEVKR